MSKNKGGSGFDNRAARRFAKIERVDQMSQQEVFEILDGDITTILAQYTAARERQGKFPQYMANAFANLSTALWVKRYVDANIKVKVKKKKGKVKSVSIRTSLSEDEVESLRVMIADAYKKSASNVYSQQTQEYLDRNKLLSKAFIKLCPELYLLTKKLCVRVKRRPLDDDKKRRRALTKAERRDLTIQVYGDPVSNMRFVRKLFDKSPLSDKKKLKLMKAMYGDRFPMAVGAAMTVDNNSSDCLAMLYEHLMKSKKKKRADYVLAYAVAFKKNKTYNFRLEGGEFYKRNKKFCKELAKEWDIGFKKAFAKLKPKRKSDEQRKAASYAPKQPKSKS